ncbi:uncharacterized protein LOC110933888 [Helianthus annuus]|uniref:uncharacterized protein LOC110933888 n=1 Tax=Helianthus annuus TaxID=4232 RepID=UPI000B8FC685|nr:uncharacterized protein LOC110933888 [Helianthus annuus]
MCADLGNFGDLVRETIVGEETKHEDVSKFDLSKVWGNKRFGSDSVGSVGHSRGRLKGSNEDLNVANIYTPQSLNEKEALWDAIHSEIVNSFGMWIVVGDFNAVRFKKKRRNCAFKARCARNFNSFIHNMGLLEYNMQGRQFTCVRDNGRKLSKIERMSVCPSFFNKWLVAHLCVLHNLFSDHGTLILTIRLDNFGPKPFRTYNSWLGKPGFKEVVITAANSFLFSGDPNVFFTKKLAHIRNRIKDWRDEMVKKYEEEENLARSEVEKLEELLENRLLSEEEEWMFSECNKVLKELSMKKGEDLRQRSHVKWAIDGDENSRFFHGIINNRKTNYLIPGVLINGNWVTKPKKVKKRFLTSLRRGLWKSIRLGLR